MLDMLGSWGSAGWIRLGGAVSGSAATPALLAALLTLLVLRMYRKAYERPEGFPPGPPRLPVWGSYWLILWEDYRYLHKGLWRLAQRYKAKIMGFYLGDYPCVLFTDYEDIKEVLSRADLAGRADVIVARERSLGGRNGVFFNDGEQWLELRRFMLRHMRDYGWGRRHPQAEAVMAEELHDAVALLKGEWTDEEVIRDGCVNTAQFFNPFALNAMWAMFGGDRLPRGKHATLRELSRAMHSLSRVTDPSGGAVSLTPWLRFFTPTRYGLDDVLHFNEKLRAFVRNAIEEHRKSLGDDNESRDFLDKFLKKMEELGVEKQSEVFSDHHLLLTAIDMMTGTVAALGAATAFLWQQLIHHPEVQARVQQEVDTVVGRHRTPTLDDRNSMTYSEATVRESLRRVTVAPLSVAHVAQQDTTFQGYTIPKGTLLYPHVGGMHMDRALWGDPEIFRPDRFIDENGKLKKDISFPFGGGKRLCPGETFSRQIMFLLMTNVMQNFTLLPSGPLPPYDHTLHGFTLGPADLWARFVPRT